MWALGINKAAKNKDAAWLFLGVGDRAAHPAECHRGLRQLQSVADVGGERSARATDHGFLGCGSYLKTVAKNLETARVAWIPQPERTREGDIWARALQEIYFKRNSAADALIQASLDVDKVL